MESSQGGTPETVPGYFQPMGEQMNRELQSKLSEPLPDQYQSAYGKALQAYASYGSSLRVAFSGGKDSALCLDMWCEICKPGDTAHVVFCDTTNETRAMKRYIPMFLERCSTKYGVYIDFVKTRPPKTFADVLKEEGIPFVSKTVSGMIRKCKKSMNQCNVTFDEVSCHIDQSLSSVRALRDIGLSNTAILALTGYSCKINDFGQAFRIPRKWLPLLSFDGQLTEKCCDILKKKPMAELGNGSVMSGELAAESKNREESWKKNGCNYLSRNNIYKSRPLMAVSEQAVLYMIKKRDIPICEDYGEITCDGGCFRCSKANRTGCALCGFGIQFDEGRFERLQESDPNLVKYAFKPKSAGGAGYKEICEFSNANCGTKIAIPEV